MQQGPLLSEADIIIAAFGTDLVTKFQVRPGIDVIAPRFEAMNGVYEGPEEPLARYCAILASSTSSTAVCRSARHLKYHRDIVADCEALARDLAHDRPAQPPK